MTYYQNPYWGYSPQPMVVQQPMVYPQQTQAVEQPQQNNNAIDSYFIWVQGEAGAKSYPVARGTTLPLFDSEGDFVYFKSVDNNGVPLPLVVKTLGDPPIEVVEEPIQTQNFVTRDSYDVLAKKYADLENRILELETKPSYTSNFNGNTFNNNRKENVDGNKLSI